MSNTVALEETNCLIIWKVKILKQFGFTIETAALQLQRDMCVSDQLPLPRPHQLRPPCILSRFSSCVFFHLSVHTTDKKYEMPNTEISSAGQCFNKAACVRPSNSPSSPYQLRPCCSLGNPAHKTVSPSLCLLMSRNVVLRIDK